MVIKKVKKKAAASKTSVASLGAKRPKRAKRSLDDAVVKKPGSLSAYRKKRNFKRTTEPASSKQRMSAKAKAPVFVVQKHNASHLHYDFRLEYRGVLKSWAVPKGIPTELGVKHLAVPTEDHPLEYATFAGTIPAGEYGAGTVKIWDHGTYQNIKKKNGKLVPMDQCLKMGRVEILLEGKKLKGGYALVRTMRKEPDGNVSEYWLILKMKDDYAD